MRFVLTALLLSTAGFVTVVVDAAAGDYSKKVTFQVFEPLMKQFPDTRSCIQTAKQKMNNHYVDVDRKFAIALVNLYTQQCELEQGRSTGVFYAKLNAELRGLSPRPFWKTTGDLVNEALTMLGMEYPSVVYRGQAGLNYIPRKGQTFKFNQITSTSRSARVVLTGFSCEVFFEINKAKGLNSQPYSYFPSEDELTLRSTDRFRVTEVLTIRENRDAIAAKMQKLNIPFNFAPSYYITMKREKSWHFWKRSVRGWGYPRYSGYRTRQQQNWNYWRTPRRISWNNFNTWQRRTNNRHCTHCYFC